MKKAINIIWKIILLGIVAGLIVTGVYVYPKRDELVTSNITMKYFEEVINNNDQKAVRTFIADGKDDVFYNNFISQLNNIYHYDGVSDFTYTITSKEVVGDGKHQSYLSGPLDNYEIIWDEENEGRYMNYMIETTITYKINDEVKERKEKGLVVFVKDMSEGNYFTWKLVRLNRYSVSA